MNKSDDNSVLNNTDSNRCSVCRELLDHLSRFFEMLDSVRKAPADNWLTVEDVAQELKVSKSIVYRIIRNGELEAINIVDRNNAKNNEKRKTFMLKGHYRIKKSWLADYLEKKKVQPPIEKQRHRVYRKHPQVKNHLGL